MPINPEFSTPGKVMLSVFGRQSVSVSGELITQSGLIFLSR
jgi:hypothetical protein